MRVPAHEGNAMSAESQDTRCAARRWALLAAGAAGVYALWRYRHYFTVRAVYTGSTPAYPEILAQVFAHSLPEVCAAAAQACASLPDWEVTHIEEDAIHAVVHRGLACAGGKVRINLDALVDGRLVKVSVLCASCGPVPDLGANARAVRDFQKRMRALLPSGGENHAG